MLDSYSLYIIVPIAFLLGIVVGSYVTMASYRFPLDIETIFKPSYCPKCSNVLKFLDLFPVFSWVANKGKCRHCHAPVSIRYPIIEICLGVTFVTITVYNGLNVNTLFYALLAAELAIIIVTDFEHFIIPDQVQIALAITGLCYRIYNYSGMGDIFISVVAGLSVGLLLHYGYLYLRKKDGLGFGDVKFFAVAGFWIPLPDFIPFFFIAGMIGTVNGLIWRFTKRGAIFPFGPALAFSLFINVLVPDMIRKLQ